MNQTLEESSTATSNDPSITTPAATANPTWTASFTAPSTANSSRTSSSPSSTSSSPTDLDDQLDYFGRDAVYVQLGAGGVRLVADPDPLGHDVVTIECGGGRLDFYVAVASAP